MNPRSQPLLFRRLLIAGAASFLFATGLRAQAPTPAPVVNGFAPGAMPTTASASASQLDHAQLETLLGPIALYPDALIALVLPASASPSDVVLAARYLNANGDPNQVDVQPWDESVRSLAHYPEVVKWMDENLSWTKQVGEAFLAQPADVMQAVQRLRARARDAGTLVDTPQQKIVTAGDILIIEPAQPNVIYVPRYDPEVVYYTRSSGWDQPYLSFGVGFAVGAWLAYDFDWPGRTLWVGDWRRQPRTVWMRPAFPNRPLRPGTPFPDARPWHPSEHRYYVPPRIVGPRPSSVIIYPRPMPGTPPRPPGGNYSHRFDSTSQPRIGPPAPGSPTAVANPPGVIMPPPHTIGAPSPDGDRRNDRLYPPQRPRSEIRTAPPAVGGVPVLSIPPVVMPPAHTIGGAPGERRPDRTDRANEPRREREPRATAPTAAPPAAQKPSSPEPNNGALLP